MAHRSRSTPDPLPSPPPTPSRPMGASDSLPTVSPTPRPSQSVQPRPVQSMPKPKPKSNKERPGPDMSDGKEPETMVVTEASVAAVMRLVNRMRDVEDVVGLWKELEEVFDGSGEFDEAIANYSVELYAALCDVNMALGEVQNRADDGWGTKDEGLVEKRAKEVLLKYQGWKQQQKQRAGEARKKESIQIKESVINRGRVGLGAGVRKKNADNSKAVQAVGVEKLYANTAEAFQVVEDSLCAGARELEEKEMLEMRKKLLEDTIQACGNPAQKGSGKVDSEKTAL